MLLELPFFLENKTTAKQRDVSYLIREALEG